LFLAGITYLLQAQEQTQKEKSSYAIGIMLGEKIKSSGIDTGIIEAIKEKVDFESLKEGIHDYLNGECKLTKEEIELNLAELQKKIEYYKKMIDAKQSQGKKQDDNPLYTELVKEAMSLYDSKEYLKAGKKFDEAFATLNGKATTCCDRYNAACSWALAKEKEAAFEQLFIVVNNEGYTNLEHINNDADLKSLHKDKRWAEIIKTVKSNKEKAQ
jgi:tetratricopeptide (TPR) repeat protein